jgi:hypothetical protein
MALWGSQLRAARQRGERIATETATKEEDFGRRVNRIESATARAERAAIRLIQRHEDLARVVAQPIHPRGSS